MVISAMVVLDVNSHQADLSTLALRPEVTALVSCQSSLSRPSPSGSPMPPIRSHSCVVRSPHCTHTQQVTKDCDYCHGTAEQSREGRAGCSVMVVTGVEAVFQDIEGITSQEANEKHK